MISLKNWSAWFGVSTKLHKYTHSLKIQLEIFSLFYSSQTNLEFVQIIQQCKKNCCKVIDDDEPKFGAEYPCVCTTLRGRRSSQALRVILHYFGVTKAICRLNLIIFAHSPVGDGEFLKIEAILSCVGAGRDQLGLGLVSEAVFYDIWTDITAVTAVTGENSTRDW